MTASAHELVSFFASELSRSWAAALGQQVPFILKTPTNPVLGSLITLHAEIPNYKTWQELLESFPSAARHTSTVRSFWQIDDDLFIRMGRDSLQAVRTDRGTSSRAHGGEYAEPFSSTKRLQLVKVDRSHQIVDTRWFDCDQALVAAYLSFALRLNPHDISSVLAAIERKNLKWAADSGHELDSMMENVPADDTSLLFALASLKIPVQLGCISDVRLALQDMRALESLSTRHPDLVSAGPPSSYCMLVHFRDGPGQRGSRHLAPSYFVHWPEALQKVCHPQVHIPDCRIVTMGNCHLVFLNLPLGVREVDRTIRELAELLGGDRTRAVSTACFRTPALFAVDGGLSRSALDLISPLAKTALSSATGGSISREITAVVQYGRPPRPPVTYIIWTRQSEQDTAATTSISRQVWSTLASLNSPLASIQRGDRLLIVVEYSSSSAHPWRDRKLHRLVSTDRPVILLTTNPDRLTRREDEVEFILSTFIMPAGSWLSQGGKFDNLTNSIWFNVAQNVDKVREQLRCGRQRAVQLAFYRRAVTTMTRYLLAEEADPQDEHLVSLHAFLKLAIEIHGIRCIVIIVRDSPPRHGDSREARNVSASLARQEQFLKSALSTTSTKLRFVQLPETSASGDEVITAISAQLAACQGRVMVMSTALDRVVRSQANYDSLRNLLQAGGHIATSLLWDSSTHLHPGDAMNLPHLD